MVQNPKGGGLSSSIGGSQMMGGVQKTTDFFDPPPCFFLSKSRKFLKPIAMTMYSFGEENIFAIQKFMLFMI
jgi:hypothetical protein